MEANAATSKSDAQRISQQRNAHSDPKEILIGGGTFFNLIKRAPFGIYLIDADFRLVEISDGCTKVFAGIDPLLGRDFGEVLRIIWPEPFSTEAIERFRHTLATGDPYHSPDTSQQRANIRVVESYDWQIERMTMPDGRYGVVCFFYETTDRVQTEQDTRFLADLTERCRAATDSRVLLRDVVRETGAYLAADRCFINEVFETEDRWTIQNDYYRDAGSSLAGEYKLSDYDAGSRASLSSGVIEVNSDTKIDPRSAERFERSYESLGIRALIVVPLLRDSAWTANFIISSESPREWQSREVSLVETVAERVWNTVERSRAEIALRQSYEFNQDVIDSLSAHVSVLDIDGVITGVNEAWRRFAQENGRDLATEGFGLGSNYLEVCRTATGEGAENAQAIYRGVKSLLDGERDSFSMEYPCHSPTQQRWYLLSASPLRRPGGGTVVSHTNITERISVEQALRESEARFRNMADHAPVMVWVTERDGTCTYLSQSWYEFTGQTPETGLGMGWLEATHPDDAANAEKSFRAANEKREAFRLEYRLRYFDGEYRWAIDSAQPRFGADGEFLGYIGSVIDIDDRKKAEEEARLVRERFDLVKEGAEVGFWFCDLPFDTLIWDNRVKEHFWLPPDAGVTIDTFYDRLHPDDRDRTKAAIEASIANHTQYDIEYRTVAPNGSENLIRAIGRTYYDAKGHPVRFDGVTLDITSRRKAEKAIRDRELLASAVKFQEAERRRIARDLHDQLGQQLTGLRLTLEDLRDNAADTPQLLEKVQKAQENASALDRDVSSLAFELRANFLRNQSLAEALRNYVSDWSSNYRVLGEFHLIDPFGKNDLPAEVETNLYRIAQEALNNAIKHAKAESVSVILDIAGDAVKLIVEDNGIGFNPATTIAGAARDDGHGMGLTGISERTELLNGNLEIDSGHGQGTTIYVTIPL